MQEQKLTSVMELENLRKSLGDSLLLSDSKAAATQLDASWVMFEDDAEGQETTPSFHRGPRIR